MHNQLDSLLRAQHGVITRAQCLTAGLSRRQVDRLLSTGLLEPVFAGVYRDPSAPRSLELRASAAVLAGGEGAVVSHRMAIALWKMRNYRCEMSEITAPHEVARPLLTAHRCRGELEARKVKRIPVTSPARTLLDCATVVSEAVLGRFLETWLSTGVVKLAALETEIERVPRHTGRRNLENALGARMITDGEPDSPSESLLGQLLVRHGLATPVLHHVVTVSTGADFELDWSYPDLLIAFELDGYGVHLRSLEAFEHDRVRRNELEIDGWTIMNFTRRLVEKRPQFVVDQVKRLLDSRAARNVPPHRW